MSNEAAEKLRAKLHDFYRPTPDEARDLLDAALASERSAAIEQMAADDEHWHRGPGASCSICRFAAEGNDR